jgi:hypothetical protein
MKLATSIAAFASTACLGLFVGHRIGLADGERGVLAGQYRSAVSFEDNGTVSLNFIVPMKCDDVPDRETLQQVVCADEEGHVSVSRWYFVAPPNPSSSKGPYGISLRARPGPKS